MGLPSSAINKFFLQSRNNTIGYELMMIANQRMQLTNEMQQVSKKYQASLNQKTFKLSTNAGASLVDLSFDNLMKPGIANKNKPYLITDLSDRIVIDNKYAKYAKIISQNGAAGGNWNSNRSQILSELTGIEVTRLDSTTETFTAEEKSLIKFYDAIFSTIAEKGWTENNQINDTNYLNQMFQNNMYTLTNVECNPTYDEVQHEIIWNNGYETSTANSCTNIYQVSDSDKRKEAEAQYEAARARIQAKETPLDTRAENLKTEQSAIQNMIESIQKVLDDNIQRSGKFAANG